MTTTLTIDGRTFTANWIKSKEGRFQPVKLMLDMPNGSHISVFKSGRWWINERIENGKCLGWTEHKTRLGALNSATDDYAAAVLDSEAFVA